ncbi:MAG: hypothetical protein DRJ40_11015 [Thermoprotei archaeon]|nr:MAG: hypothetical protein DRJ40_11015 [Thermoprotei archaeon]
MQKTDYRKLWEVRRKLYVDWTIRDILYRLLIRARLEGIYHYVPAVIDKIIEDINHLNEVFTVADMLRAKGFAVFILEPACSEGDLLAIKGVRSLLIEVKTHPPPYKGHTDLQRDYYLVTADELRKHGIQLLYVWFNNKKKIYECTTPENMEVVNDKVIAKKVWSFWDYISGM